MGAYKFILFLQIENDNRISQIVRINKSVTKMVTGCCKIDRNICIIGLKMLLVKYENMGLCLYVSQIQVKVI